MIVRYCSSPVSIRRCAVSCSTSPFGDHRRGVAEDPEHLEAAVLDHQLERPAEQEIADQDARRIAPDEVGGALAAAHARAVDDVVVEQGRGMDELDRGGELVVARAGVAEQVGAGERQHRPHALAAAGDQVAGELRDQRDLALHPLEDHRIDPVHVLGDERDHRLERRLAFRMQRMDGGGHGAALAGPRRFS